MDYQSSLTLKKKKKTNSGDLNCAAQHSLLLETTQVGSLYHSMCKSHSDPQTSICA